ncbi:MAG: beta-galactosidase [Chloroflexi bacterium]|nr:beta-galactosidase [Chloroflexota bacterium]
MLNSFRYKSRRFFKLLTRPGWLLLLTTVYMVFSTTWSPVEYVELGEAQVVQTTKPQVCVHTLLENEVQERKIKRSLELVREMGATTIVQFFPWAYFEPGDDQYNWTQADIIVRHAKNQGLRIIARLGLVPDWARPATSEGRATTLNYLPEASFDDFAQYASQLAARYPEEIRHFIIWNEPNLSFEWGYRPVDPAAYVRLLGLSYRAIKEANPQALVLAGALAPTNEVQGSPAGLNENIYLREMYSSGAAPHFDALAVHSYGSTEPADAEPSADRLNFRRVEFLRQIMVEAGDAAKPVFITESGWNDHPRWTGAVRPSQRLQYTIKAFEFAQSNWNWAQQLCIWAFRYPAPLNGYPDNFTLVSPEFDLKPIYYAIQDYARGWERSPSGWLPPPEAS